MGSHVVEPISISEVKSRGTDRFNTNNHWPDGKPPHDYQEVGQKSETRYWIDKFREQYTIINIDPSELIWMKQAANVGSITAGFSGLFKDDLQNLIQSHSETAKIFSKDQKYFVRTETVSLKYGMHGAGPYTDLQSIVESLVTSTSGHAPVHHHTETLKLYLLPWKTISMDTEFRIFVHNSKITAISQQSPYIVNQLLASFPSDERVGIITNWLNIILDYHQKVIVKKITHLDSYVIDLALINDAPYFIEINPFGKEYSSGSALYHWIIDGDILYGKSKSVHFRYVVE